MRVSWWRWRLVQFTLLAIFSVVFVPTTTSGQGFMVATYAVLWGWTLTTAAITAEMIEDELVIRAPLRTQRIPLHDVVLSRRWTFPTARLGRRGRWWAAWDVPYTSDTKRLLRAVERARGSSRGTS